MKNLKINKEKIISLLLAGSIVLCINSCTRQIKNNKDNPKELITIETSTPVLKEPVSTETSLPISDEITYDKDTLFYHQLLTNYKYIPFEGNQQFILDYGTSIYFVENDVVTNKFINENGLNVVLLSAQHDYAKVMLPNGSEAYVNIASLKLGEELYKRDSIDLEEETDGIIKKNTFLYDYDGTVIKHLYAEQDCKVISKGDKYSTITLPDDSYGWVLNNTLVNNYQRIDGHGFIRQGTNIYYDNEFTNLAYTVTDYDQIFYVDFTTDEYAGVFDYDGREIMYVRPSELDKDYIIVDLDSQQMDCYLDYKLVGSWGTRTGKNSSPTHPGAFDIDWKAKDWEFTTYPGSYAKYWIPINEYGEGIHDLIGDDEQNYGNYAYQLDGSHGCIRVPAAASEFVYNNYEVGDMVLVRKK